MKKFRIADCIGKDGKRAKFAIFADGSERKLIQNHEDYGEYFCVDNEICKDFDPDINKLFSGRIKDAVETIKNGNGDVISISSFFGIKIMTVLYFLNRDIGEELRQESIEGYKNAQFGWQVEVGNSDSLEGFHPLDDEDEIIGFGNQNKPKFYDTKEEAEAHAQNILDKARKCANRYTELKQQKDANSENPISIIRKEIENENHNGSFIIIQFMIDLLNSSEDKVRSKYQYQVTQCIVY